MKLLTVGVVVGLLALGLTANVWADGNAGQTGAAAPAVTAPATGTPAPGTAAPQPSPKDVKLERLAKEVKTVVASADNLMKLCDEEMAKPQDKQDIKKALGLKMNAARLYVQAAGKAKANAGQLAKEDKQAFLDQYEQPNREKAITLFLELAAATKEKKDYTDAIGLYNTVLKIDPKNATAVAGIKAVQDEMKTAQANPGNGSQGGNSDQQIQQQKPWQDYKSSYNGWNTWTPSGGGYGYTKY